MNITCSSCGQPVSTDQKFCSYCGAEVVAPSNNFCINCGTKLEPGQKFCVKCGTQVGAGSANTNKNNSVGEVVNIVKNDSALLEKILYSGIALLTIIFFIIPGFVGAYGLSFSFYVFFGDASALGILYAIYLSLTVAAIPVIKWTIPKKGLTDLLAMIIGITNLGTFVIAVIINCTTVWYSVPLSVMFYFVLILCLIPTMVFSILVKSGALFKNKN